MWYYVMSIGGMKMFPDITPSEVTKMIQKKEKIMILDVRERREVATGKIPGAKNIPLGEILKRLSELNRHTEYIVVCQSGGRSSLACEWLSTKGFKVKNMTGGMNRWLGKVE